MNAPTTAVSASARELIRRLDALDRALAAKNFPPMTSWWRATIVRFYESGRRQAVWRCGRRSGKSSMLCRIAVLEALWGNHRVTPGDVGIVGFISTKMSEASGRLRMIKAILDALNVPYKPIDDGIELLERPVVFKVFAASVASVVGGTLIFCACDELARWMSAETGANPAPQVLASVRPTMATQPNARLFLSSSPLGNNDAHAVAFDEGDNDYQLTAWAPTWIAHPELTEAECRKLERHEGTFQREYGSVPQVGALGAFDMADVDACIMKGSASPPSSPIAVIDSSAGACDSWAFCMAGYHAPFHSESVYHDGPAGFVRMPSRVERGKEILRIAGLSALEGSFGKAIPFNEVVRRVAASARRVGARHVHGDQYQAYPLASAFAAERLGFTSHPWTSNSKVEAVSLLRRWFAERTIQIDGGPEAEKLRSELSSFEERINANGVLTYGGRRGRHDDRVALLITLAHADLEGQVGGSPMERRSSKSVDTNFTFG